MEFEYEVVSGAGWAGEVVLNYVILNHCNNIFWQVNKRYVKCH